MYNWRFLLLAFFAVFHPIAFADRSLVDGRQHCCDHRLERDSAYSIYGDSRLKVPSEEYRVITQRRETREVQRDDRQYENTLSRVAVSTLKDSSERENRRSTDLHSSRTEFQRQRESHARTRNGLVTNNRARITQDVLRDTRSDRFRIAENRQNLNRVTLQNSRDYEISREPSSRVSRDVFESANRDERITNIVRREPRYMETNRDRSQKNTDNRETRVELRRSRDTVSPTERLAVQYNRRTESDQRRVLRFNSEKNERNFRTLDRLSRIQSDGTFGNKNEFTEMRFRDSNRKIDSRPAIVNSRDRRSVDRAIKKDSEFRVNIGDRAYEIDELRNNIRKDFKFRSIQRTVTQNADESRSSLPRSLNDNTRTRSLSADRLFIRQIRNVRRENHELLRNNIRIESRFGREFTQRLSRSESRHPELNREHVLDSRESEINEIRRLVASDLTKDARDTREQLRELSRDRRDRNTESRRSHIIRNSNILQQRRDNNRDRDREMELQERINSDQRLTRKNLRMETRDMDRTRAVSRDNISMRRIETRTTISERQIRERDSSDSRPSLKLNDRESTRGQRNVRDNERRETRTMDPRDNIAMRRIESRITMNDRRSIERDSSELNRLSPRTNNREITREQRHVRDSELITRERGMSETNKLKTRTNVREISRNLNNVRDNERRTREHEMSIPKANRLSSRFNDREISRDRNNVRDNERRTNERENYMSEANKLSLRINDQKVTPDQRIVRENERRTKERDMPETSRLSSKLNNQQIVRNHRNIRENERRTRERDLSEATRLSARFNDREMARNRNNVRDNERRTRERDMSEATRLSARFNDREMARNRNNVRDNERRTRERDMSEATRLPTKFNEREVARDRNDERRTRERELSEGSRLSSMINHQEIARDRYNVRDNERRTRDKDMSESHRLSSTINDRAVARDRRTVRDNELRETRNADRTREMSRHIISMRRVESLTKINERRIRERDDSASMRLAKKTSDQLTARDNERRETVKSDRTRENISMRRIETRVGTDYASIRLASPSQKNVESETHETAFSWQYLIYTLQAIYLCSVLIPMTLAKKQTMKKTKSIGWWTPFQAAIKMD